MIAKQRHPPCERARHACGQQAGARNVIDPQRPQTRDGGGRRRWSLATDHLNPVAGCVPQDDGDFAAEPIQMRLDDLKHEARSHGGVERVAAHLERRHAAFGGQPMCGAHHAKRALELGPGRERRFGGRHQRCLYHRARERRGLLAVDREIDLHRHLNIQLSHGDLG